MLRKIHAFEWIFYSLSKHETLTPILTDSIKAMDNFDVGMEALNS